MSNQTPGSALAPRREAELFIAAIAVILVMLGIVGWALFDARQAARRQAGQETGNIALALAGDIGRVINSLDLSLRGAVQGMATPGLAAMDPATRQAILFDGAIAADQFNGAIITDETGRVIYDSSSLTPRPINISVRPYFQAHRTRADLGLTIGPPVRSLSRGDWAVAMTRRINHADGSFAGVAQIGVPLRFFQSLFGAIDIGTDGTVSLLNKDGLLIVRRPFAEADIGHEAVEPTLMRDLMRNPGSSLKLPPRGDRISRIYSFRRVADLPLVVGVGVSVKEVYAEWATKTVIIGGGLLLLSALVLCLAWLFRRELRLRIQAEQTAYRAAAASEALAGQVSQALAPLDALFQNSADSMLVVRVRPDGDFAYEAVNPVWENVVGIAATDAIGRAPEACLLPELGETVTLKWRQCVRERRATRFVFQTSLPPTARDWEDLVAPIFGEDGEISRLIVVSREITERNRLAAELHQAQKMEVIGRLAAGVSHDFNNILQVIAGGLEILQEETLLSAEGHDWLDMCERAVRRGAYLTHHLLSYSRKQALNPKPFDLREVLGTLRDVLARTMGTHISVTIEVAPSIGWISADRAQFETALMNLAINAAHAMPQGGKLRIGADSVEAEPFGELGPGRYVVIAVTDNGTGMTPEVLACIFDPFFTTKGSAGTGLGLAMVQGFCRQSGGDIRVMSAPGEGSRFEIWLPEITASAPADRPADGVRRAARRGNVLLVDDDADVLIMVDVALRMGGFTVRQVQNSQQALAAFNAGERFDVLVTDYMMAGMNGLALIQQARAYQPALPALIISGFADVADFMTDLPDAALLRKPFRRDQLIAEINTLLGLT